MFNFQISVLLWTIISFCALAFILDKFLFKPLFKVMDARNEKISSSRRERKAIIDEYEAKKAQAEADRINAQKEAMSSGDKLIEQEKAKTEKELSKAKDKYDALLDEERGKLQNEAAEIEKELDAKVEELALEYVAALSIN